MKWLVLAARVATAGIPALVVCFLSSVLANSRLPAGSDGLEAMWRWIPTLITFGFVFFGIPVLAKIGNLSRKVESPSAREAWLLVVLVFLGAIAAVVVIPNILYAAHFARLNQ